MSFKIGDSVKYKNENYVIDSVKSLGASSSYVLKNGNYKIAVYGQQCLELVAN